MSSLENAPMIGRISHGLLAGALLAALLLLPVFPVAAVFFVFVLVGLNAFCIRQVLTGNERNRTGAFSPVCAGFWIWAESWKD